MGGGGGAGGAVPAKDTGAPESHVGGALLVSRVCGSEGVCVWRCQSGANGRSLRLDERTWRRWRRRWFGARMDADAAQEMNLVKSREASDAQAAVVAV